MLENEENAAANEENEDAADISAKFTDMAFNKALRQIIQKPYPSPIYESDVSGIESLCVASEEIESLSGIEYFTSLKTLNCSDNLLTSLDVSQNCALTELDCENNLLTSLDLTNNPALKNLFCCFNNLTSLDLSKNPELSALFCCFNHLPSLDASNNPSLIKLWCHGNHFTASNALRSRTPIR